MPGRIPSYTSSGLLDTLPSAPILGPANDHVFVGSAEYEIPISALGLKHLPEEIKLSTIRFRAFYPAIVEGNLTKGVPWVPTPQTAHLEGYLKMARLGPWISSMLLSVPLFLRSTMMPVHGNARMAYQDTRLPVLVFSHGLVGSLNTHSAILGEIASHGVCCFALEHRDGSGALSQVRNGEAAIKADAPSEMSSVYFERMSLRIRPGVLEQRDRQIRIRIFELMGLYRCLEMLNEGTKLQNYASSSRNEFTSRRGSINLDPSSVIWAGHSFGGVTIIQFIKSIYHRERENIEGGKEGKSILMQDPLPSLAAQITPTSPIVLLDPWFMPLKAPNRHWLLCKPLPCHDATTEINQQSSSTTVVMSTEFAYHWPQCHSYMPAITSPDPGSIKVQTQEEYDNEFESFTSPRDFMNKSKKAYAASAASRKEAVVKDALVQEDEKVSPVASFELRESTHVTHSDFGLLFQWFTWWVTGQKKPELAVQNIAYCVLEAAGLPAGRPQSDAARAELKRLS